jgi:putative GTP pyrophosphokinase
MNADYTIRDEYAARHSILVETAEKLQGHLKQIVSELSRIDSVVARAKDPDRYFAKAVKTIENGEAKYKDPKYEIQDQIGARINVLYLSDVEIVRLHLMSLMNHIEEAPKSPEDDSAFGYVGHHFIFQTPDDVISDDSKDAIPEFFELQIKTLFQHAWSETHHDIGYKAPRKLTSDERRQIAFTAAQAWGADKIFEELAKSLVVNDNDKSLDP